MIIDSSVIVAIAIGEPEQDQLVRVMDAASIRRMSAGTWIELSAVATRRQIIPLAWLDTLLASYDIEIESVSAEQAAIGHQAYREYGLGTGHRARLNFGDCFAYALAKALDEPLLFKGDDFVHTNVKRAI